MMSKQLQNAVRGTDTTGPAAVDGETTDPTVAAAGDEDPPGPAPLGREASLPCAACAKYLAGSVGDGVSGPIGLPLLPVCVLEIISICQNNNAPVLSPTLTVGNYLS